MSDLTNASPVDIVKVPSTENASAELVFSISAELMHNCKTGSPIDPTENIAVVQDSQGSPMIFTINGQGVFYIIKHDNGSADGWSPVDLSGQFDGHAKAVAFDVSQDVAGNVSVAVAMGKADTSATDIFMAGNLSNDYSRMDWSKFADHCAKVSGIDANFEADHILMGMRSGSMDALTVITGDIDKQKRYYQIQDNKTSRALEFPENVNNDPDAVSAMAIGHTYGQRGVAFLYKVGQAQTLEVTTLDGDGGEKRKSYDYSPQSPAIPEKLRNKHMAYSCIATAPGRDTDPFSISSDLYVGSDTGIYVFPGGKAGAMQEITSSLKDVHEIAVRTDSAGNVSIWAMVSPNDIYYIYGRQGDTYSWNAPVKFSGNAIHIAPTRSASKKSNELLLVNQDQTLTHYWQDPGSTLWHHRTLSVKGGGSVINFNSFTTHINVADAGGTPRAGQSLRITSSEWIYATINGLIYSLDKDNPAVVATDGIGNVTIITDTGDVASPIFHVEGDNFDKTLNVYPNGKITKGLRTIQSGDDLKNAKTQADENVVTDPSIRKNADTLNGIAGSVKQLSLASSDQMSGLGDNTYTIVGDRGVRTASLINSHAASHPAGFVLGMEVKNGAWVAVPHGAALSAGFMGDFTHWAGDVIHEIGHFFEEAVEEFKDGFTVLKDGVKFLIHKVEEGFQFVLHLGEKVYNILLDTISAVGRVISWVFSLIKVALEKFLEWLGHLLGWDDIWATHKVIAKLMTNMLDYSVKKVTDDIDQWKDTIGSALDTMKQDVKSLVIPAGVRARIPASNAKSDHASSPYATLLNSPGGNYSLYHMQHGWIRGSASGYTGGNPFTQFLDDVLIPTTTALFDDIKDDLANIRNLLETGSVEAAYDLINGVIDTVFDPLKKLVLGILDFLEDLIKDIQSVLEDDMDIPLLSDLYKFITKLLGEEESLTGINAVSLILAIPATYVFKAANGGKAPFDNHQAKALMEDPRLVETLLGGGVSSKPSVEAGSTAAAVLSVAATPVAASSAPASPAAVYAGWGGFIASLSGIGLSAMGILTSLSDSPPEGGTKKVVMCFTAGLGLIKFGGTFPVPGTRTKTASTVLKIICWGTALLNTCVGMLLPSKAAGCLLVAADLLILILAMVADGISASSTVWLTWLNDILSNLSGIATGVGKVSKETEVGAIILTVGVGFTFISSATGMFGALVKALSTDTDVFHLVNVGGL